MGAKRADSTPETHPKCKMGAKRASFAPGNYLYSSRSTCRERTWMLLSVW